jgi:hypothetical protein
LQGREIAGGAAEGGGEVVPGGVVEYAVDGAEVGRGVGLVVRQDLRCMVSARMADKRTVSSSPRPT